MVVLVTVVVVWIAIVVLYGEPGAMLRQYAAEHGYEVIVMGSSGATSSHLLRRRPALALVPLLIGPATR